MPPEKMEGDWQEIRRDASNLAFYTVYQAIMDAFELASIHISGDASKRTKELNKLVTYREARDFINSEYMDAFCELAAEYHEIPPAVVIRRRLKAFLDSGEKMDIRELYAIAMRSDMKREDDCGTPPSA